MKVINEIKNRWKINTYKPMLGLQIDMQNILELRLKPKAKK